LVAVVERWWRRVIGGVYLRVHWGRIPAQVYSVEEEEEEEELFKARYE
jgi:hypothetical protein